MRFTLLPFLNVEVNNGFCEYSIFMSPSSPVPEKLIRDLHMRFVDTYLEDVSTVDITATYVNLLGAIPAAITLSFVLVQSVFLSPFLFATQSSI